jgi:hypothetical protein
MDSYCPDQPLKSYKTDCQDQTAQRRIIIELGQELSNIIGQSTRDGNALYEIVRIEKEHLQLFLIVQGTTLNKAPKAKNDDAEKDRQQDLAVCVKDFLH